MTHCGHMLNYHVFLCVLTTWTCVLRYRHTEWLTVCKYVLLSGGWGCAIVLTVTMFMYMVWSGIGEYVLPKKGVVGTNLKHNEWAYSCYWNCIASPWHILLLPYWPVSLTFDPSSMTPAYHGYNKLVKVINPLIITALIPNKPEFGLVHPKMVLTGHWAPFLEFLMLITIVNLEWPWGDVKGHPISGEMAFSLVVPES